MPPPRKKVGLLNPNGKGKKKFFHIGKKRSTSAEKSRNFSIASLGRI